MLTVSICGAAHSGQPCPNSYVLTVKKVGHERGVPMGAPFSAKTNSRVLLTINRLVSRLLFRAVALPVLPRRAVFRTPVLAMPRS